MPAGASPPGRTGDERPETTSRAMTALVALRPGPMREETGPGASGEVASVVNAMDGGKSTAVPLDLVNAGRAKI